MAVIDDILLKAWHNGMPRRELPFPVAKHWAWPSQDKGEWAPKSLLVIYHENGLPDEFSAPCMAPFWRRVEAGLTNVFGFPVFIESVNPAVSAVWKA